MVRIAFALNIRPGCEDEYKRRHASVWPEVRAEMKAAGLASMSIFLLGSQAIVFVEAEDYERAATFLASAPASRQWEEYTAEVVAFDPEHPWPEILPLIFDWRATEEPRP